jgi:hypothetical protein
MTLYDKDDADWYLVKVRSGEIGLAPSNYIRQVCVMYNCCGPARSTDADLLALNKADTHEEPQPKPSTPIAQPQELSPSPPPLPVSYK